MEVERRGGRSNIGTIWVGNSLVNVRQVEVGGVLWVLLNVLDGHRDQRGDCGGE